MKKQWYEDDRQYVINKPIPLEFEEYGTLSLIRVYSKGGTETGWGAKDWAEQREAGRFDPDRSVRYFEKYQQPFAFVMRSIPFVCIDVDGKNNGQAFTNMLQLPETLAERSKSGNGWHLIYRVPGAAFDSKRGFAEMEDHNGVLPGIDVRGTGAMFHYPNQQWNRTKAADLPMSLYALLENAQRIRHNARLTAGGTLGLSEDELVIVHDRLATQLAMRAPVGTRNQRLYAIGTQMFASNYPDWEMQIRLRGEQLGLDVDEVEQILENIIKYAH
jgi:hypothetical protein